MDDPIRICIVSDSERDRQWYAQLLHGTCSVKYEISQIPGSQLAGNFCLNDSPDCVLLQDGQPNGASEHLVSELFRQNSQSLAILVIGETADVATATRMIRAGAADYLDKNGLTTESLNDSIRVALREGIDRREQQNKIDELAALLAQMRAELKQVTTELALNKQELERKISELQKKQANLVVAEEIQKGLLPKAPPCLPGWSIAGICVPAEETGGDFFGYINLPNEKLGVYVGDVTGHGVGPAILAAEARAYFRALAQVYPNPGDILAFANQLICEDTNGERFITAFLIALDPVSRYLHYASAGHHAYLIAADGKATHLQTQQQPMGIEPMFVTSEVNDLRLNPGELLVLLTDGVFEVPSSESGSVNKTDRLLQVIAEHRHESAQEIIAAVFEAARGYTAKEHPPDDDITLVVIKCCEPRSFRSGNGFSAK